MEGFDFAAEIRVRFAETDAQGVAHNSNYLVWFEVARVDVPRAVRGRLPAAPRPGDRVVRARVARRGTCQPARFDDRLLVHARCHAVRGARFRFDYAVERDGTTIADGWTEHATVDAATLRPTRLPAVADRRDRYGSGFPVGVVAVGVSVSAGFGFGFGLGFAFGPTRTIFGDET